MLQSADINSDLVIQANTEGMRRQIILIMLHNPNETQEFGSVSVNGTQIFGKNIGQSEDVTLSVEKILLEKQGDNVTVSGNVNKIISYMEYGPKCAEWQVFYFEWNYNDQQTSLIRGEDL